MRSRNGFTLVETLIVVVILGLVMLIGFPKMSSALVRNDLRAARTAVINLTAKARAVAAQSNRRTWVKFNGNHAFVIARPRLTVGGGGDVDTLGGVQDLAELYKVGLAAGADSIQFDPRGFGSWIGAATIDIVLARGGYSEIIQIDGLGRVIK